jgi:hypothetical protein
MGWKRRGSKPIELSFKFDSPRFFSRVDIFASNRIDLNIQVFKRAFVWIKTDDDEDDGLSTTFEYMPDKAMQMSRNVSIGLEKNLVGRVVKIQLTFANIWMLVSEIGFESRVATEEDYASVAGDVSGSAEVPDLPPLLPSVTTHMILTDELFEEAVAATEATAETMEKEDKKGAIKQGTRELKSLKMDRFYFYFFLVERATENSAHLEVIIGVLTAVTLLLLFLFVAVLMYSRRQKLLNSPTSRSLNPFPVQLNMKDLLMNMSSPNSAGIQCSPVNLANITSNPNYLSDGSGHGGVGGGETSTTSFYADPFRPSPQLFEDALLEESRSKWHSTGHVPDGGSRSTTFRDGIPHI